MLRGSARRRLLDALKSPPELQDEIPSHQLGQVQTRPRSTREPECQSRLHAIRLTHPRTRTPPPTRVANTMLVGIVNMWTALLAKRFLYSRKKDFYVVLPNGQPTGRDGFLEYARGIEE